MLWLGETWLFAPWVYLVVMFGSVWNVRRDRASLALGSSGLATAAVIFVHAYSAELRGSLWLVTCALIVTVVALVRLAKARRE
jgi:hypothetical protein